MNWESRRLLRYWPSPAGVVGDGMLLPTVLCRLLEIPGDVVAGRYRLDIAIAPRPVGGPM